MIKLKSSVKNNNKYNAKLSNETKELIKNISYTEMKSCQVMRTKNVKMLSVLSRKVIVKDQNSEDRKHINSNIKNPKALWKLTKDKLYRN